MHSVSELARDIAADLVSIYANVGKSAAAAHSSASEPMQSTPRRRNTSVIVRFFLRALSEGSRDIKVAADGAQNSVAVPQHSARLSFGKAHSILVLRRLEQLSMLRPSRQRQRTSSRTGGGNREHGAHDHQVPQEPGV